MHQENRYFELFVSGNYLRLTIIKHQFPNAQDDWDKNILDVKVSVKSGAFLGELDTIFMTTDFESFKQQLRNLYINLNGTATFSGYEHSDMIKLRGNGLGHLNVECQLTESNIPLNELKFELDLDQTFLPSIINQINLITKEFPIIGDFSKIKNEY
jgi:hypothetical protein